MVNHYRNHPKYGTLASEIVSRWKDIAKRSGEIKPENEEMEPSPSKKKPYLNFIESSKSDYPINEISTTVVFILIF